MKSESYDLIVIGAGAMGLAAAYEACLQGKRTLVLEADSVAGGMAAHFDLDGLSVERYYHFICKTDFDTFNLLSELGIREKLKWTATKMGYYFDGKLYPWGNPLALLAFPKIGLLGKIRYALMALYCTKRSDWSKVEPLTAPEWFKAWLGEDGYRKLWHRLFHLKFYEFTDNISATWIGTRIKRIGLSRKSMFEEQLGYLEGGTETLVSALVNYISKHGGEIICDSPVIEILSDKGGVTGVKTKTGKLKANRVISTVPTPFISHLVPQFPDALKAQYDAIDNIGVLCLIFKLKQSVTENFWVNIVDENIPIPGIIEFSNLRIMEENIVYVPYYMPTSNERWAWSDKDIIDEAFVAIKSVNPNIRDDDILSYEVSRLKYAQPICPPNFLEELPNIQTPISGLQVADTCYYYPEDRGISESIGLGRKMAQSTIELA